MDEEFLPFPDQSFDLVTSSLSLHWVNDLPRALSEIRRVLKPDGCFIGAMLGGSTLTELRESMILAETEREGGVSPHVSPMAGASDAGGLLGAAGFSLPTVDVDAVVVEYADAFMLMEELQGMGEENAGIGRRGTDGRPYMGRDAFLAAAAIYHASAAASSQGSEIAKVVKLDTVAIPATFQVIYMIGWAPHESQQRADKRGTASRSLSEISVTSSKRPAP